MDMLNVKINGISVSVEKGSTVLEAARIAGVEIPTLCFMKEKNEIGACRICVVEVNEGRGFRIVTACVYNNYIYTADNSGKIYKEDFGTTFNGSPVKFMWKSPFLAITSPHHRKMIDEFYFLLDTEYDNDFDFSVYKDYDSEYSDDIERIY